MPVVSPHLQQWRDALAGTRSRAASLVLPLTSAHRARSPAAGAWSVDRILEHMAAANALYAASMKKALAAHPVRASHDAGEWKPTWLGRLLRTAVDPQSQRKLPAPRRIVPGPTVHAGVLERFVSGIDDLTGLMEMAAGADLRRVRFASPLARLIKLNLGDGFAICVAHTARHTDQIARTIVQTK